MVESIKKPVIAAVNGFALGGGCELALACDIRVASNRARFGQTEIKWGMIPAAGACQRLRMIVGIGRAKEIIFTGRLIEAEEAFQLGIYNRVVTEENLIEEVKILASEIANNSPVAIKQAKKAIDTLNGKEIDGRAIIVNEARPREERGTRRFNR